MRNKLIWMISVVLLLGAIVSCPTLAQTAKPAEPAKQSAAPPAATQKSETVRVGAVEVSGTTEKVRGDIVVEKGQTLKEVSTVQGDVTVYGHVTRDATAVRGNVEVKSGGKVDGDATAVMGNVIIHPGGDYRGRRDRGDGRSDPEHRRQDWWKQDEYRPFSAKMGARMV